MTPIKFSVFYKNNHLDDFFLIPRIQSQTVIQFYSEFNDEVFYDSVAQLERTDNGPANSVKILRVIMDGYLCSLFYFVLRTSVPYRMCFTRNICKNILNDMGKCKYRLTVFVKLVPPYRDVIDFRGNELFEIVCLERRELDNAMAWLSTLGGAFSALGDSIEKCATIAGKISVRQLQLALRLGDPFLVARCKLYMALSFIQRHKFKQAKQIVRAQYAIATQGTLKDNKLRSMCLGIWAKLKYDKSRLKLLKRRELLM